MSGNNLPLEKGERVARLSTFVLLALGIVKGVVAFFSGSVALSAGAMDTFSDVLSSVAVWVGLRIANKEPTERFPYGYYKAETFASLVVSVIIVASSVLIMLESWQKFFEVNVISFSNLALAASALSALIYYLIAKFKQRVGRQIGSQALASEGLHSMVDVYTSVLVFAGVFLSAFGFQVFEAFVGLLISVYVLIRGLLFGKDAALVLMDVSPDPRMVKEIKEIAEGIPEVEGTHGVRLRKSGPVFFGEMHVELQEDLSLKKAHKIANMVEAKVKERLKNLQSLTVHAGITHNEKKRIAIPTRENKGLKSLTSPRFGNAPYFTILEMEEDQITDYTIKENEGASLSHKKDIKTARWLIEKKVDVLLTSGLGKDSFRILRDHQIQIYHLPKSMKIKEAIRLLNKNLLEKWDVPTGKHGD